MSLSRSKVDSTTMLLAAAVDRLSFLAYANTKDAQHHRNAPKSILQELLKDTEKPKTGMLTFSSGAEFEAARAKLLENLE